MWQYYKILDHFRKCGVCGENKNKQTKKKQQHTNTQKTSIDEQMTSMVPENTSFM